MIASFAGAAACDVGGPDPEKEELPGLRVVAVDVTTRGFDVNSEPALVSTPIAPDGSTRPTIGTSIRVRLNRFADPSTATRQAICVQSSTAEVRVFSDCAAGLLLRPSYDPVLRTVTYFLETDTTQLAPDTFYRVTVLHAEGKGVGLRAFDGPALAGPVVLDFTTESANPDDPAPTEGPDLDINFCSSSRCLATCSERLGAEGRACRATCDERGIENVLESCAFAGCHQTDGQEKVPMGLDLFAAEGVAATAIARVAHGTQRGAGAQNPDEAGLAFGRAMPIIAPGDAGNSYLLYKILANPAFLAPDLEPKESDRLRATFVVGAPMPPTASAAVVAEGEVRQPATNSPLALEDAARFSRWIAAGADTTRCGPPLGAPPTP